MVSATHSYSIICGIDRPTGSNVTPDAIDERLPLPPECLSGLAPILRDMMVTHARRCPVCRRRWERATRLRSDRANSLPDDIEGIEHQGVVYDGIMSPLGTLWIAASDRGICRVSCDEDELTFCYEIERHGWGAARCVPSRLASATTQLTAYFAGRGTTFDLPIDYSHRTAFQREVLETVRLVPYGEKRSYREIAAEVGRPNAMRAVGTVMATNVLSIIIPCHRVVRSDGAMGQYGVRSRGACGMLDKHMLLALEGAGLDREAVQEESRQTGKRIAL